MTESHPAGSGGVDQGRPPPTGVLHVLGTFVGIAAGGILTGVLVALTTAPRSEVALPICAAALPLAFGFGLTAWRSLLAAWLVTTLGRSLFRSRGDAGRFREETMRAFQAARDEGAGRLPFTWVFVPVGIGVGLVAAILLLLLDGDATTAAVILVAASTVQGLVLRRLARAGRLPLPD